jgi:hypothetical protein
MRYITCNFRRHFEHKKILSLIVIIIACITLMDAMTLTIAAFAEGQERASLVKVIHVLILQWMLL